MNEVLLKILEGRATLAERREVQRWRDAAPANEKKYREMLRLWNAIPTAASNEPTGLPPHVGALVARAHARPFPHVSALARGRRRTLLLAAIIAGGTAFAGAGFGASSLIR